jgi:ABC-2 type transport system ATP-binding protein
MIHVRDLVKTYHVSTRGKGSLWRRRTAIRALDGLSFDIAKGEVVGYIGPNGAGKSTTIKILSGILHPDAGSCVVDGRIPWLDRIAHVRGLGVVFGQRTQLWWDLPARDSLELLGDMYGVPQQPRSAVIAALDRELGLAAFMDTPVRQLSLGQRMRCELAAALVHQPAILFLDEPTIGLDAPSKLAIRDFIRRLNREHGTTVILTTHDMDDVEALAGRVILIGKGQALYDGSLAGLRSEARAEKRIVLDLAELPTGSIDPPSALRLVSQAGARLVLAFDPVTLPTGEALSLAARAWRVADLSVESRPVEEIVAELYRKHGV